MEIEIERLLETQNARLQQLQEALNEANAQKQQLEEKLDALRESKDEMESILDSSKTGIWTILIPEDGAPRLYPNATMRLLLGVDEAATPETCYQIWYSNIAPDYVDIVNEAVQEILQKGRSEVMYPWKHPIKGKIYIRCGGVRNTKTKQAGICINGFHQDITETMVTRQRQEKAIMDALVEAKTANRAKNEFLSHMSHDIRTPINGILGMLNIAEKNALDLELQKACRKKIRASAEHLFSLISDVLAISKLESGAFHFTQEPFDLLELLDNCINILEPQARAQRISMKSDFSKLSHTKLIGSPLHLRQILNNIIGNAIKYNQQNGTVFFSVQTLSEQDGTAELEFIVADTGRGMHSEFVQQRLFEPFAQEDNNVRTNFNGVGLGLSITKKLVDQMSGTITVESEYGKGSTFCIRLPFPLDTQSESTIENEAEPIDTDIADLQVLLVEDNELNSEIVQYMLEDEKAVVTLAENGKIATDLFAASDIGAFDCILMDIMMPVMDGLEATRCIRAMKRADAKTVSIIALSANAFPEDIQAAKDAGMNDYLSKPVYPNQLLSTLGRIKVHLRN